MSEMSEYNLAAGIAADAAADIPPPAPSKPKRISRKTRDALEAEFSRGYAEAMERDRGFEMIGNIMFAAIMFVAGLSLGFWLS